MSESPRTNWEIIRYNPNTLQITMIPVTLSLEAAIKLIPSFSGGNDTDLSAFVTKCDFVFSNVNETIKPIILNAIIAQLTGKAFETIRYREFTEWTELKNHFRTIFCTKHSVNYLQKALSSIKQERNEKIQDFAGRIEKIYHELTHALIIGKTATEAKTIAQTVQGQALSVFMSGVHPAINTILEARAVETFELAVVIATEKEQNFEDRRPKFDKNNYRNKKTNKCNRCYKMGHYANECRSNITNNSGFRNPTYNNNTYIKQENTGQVKFCKYCKRSNHDIKDCRKRIFNESKKKQEREDTTSNETRTASEIQNNVRVITQMKEEHITCESKNFEPRNINFLIDSGSDMNLIKISSIEKNVIVNEQDKRPIRGINSTLVYTLGSIVTPIQINEGTFIIKFSVVKNDFPIPGAGIIGRNFLKDNKVILDLSQELFIIPEPISNNQFIIPPRSNCVLLIQNDENIKHDHITIIKQDINDDVILANSISPVQGDKIISNVINISEQPFFVDELSTKNNKWEPYDEKVLVTNKTNANSNRINKLREAIQVDHLNSEEESSIYELCSEYADIFFLEGDQLGATDIVKHNINIPRNLKPMNIRPYRLPWAFQEEIEKQVKQMKQDKIIRNSTTPFNFPLVVVKKKNLNNQGKPKLRICVDFRKQNEVIENEACEITELFRAPQTTHNLRGTTSCDLRAAPRDDPQTVAAELVGFKYTVKYLYTTHNLKLGKVTNK